MKEEQPIVVNLPEGQNTLTFLQGQAPKQLDILAPLKIEIHGAIDAPFRWLEKRVEDIDVHKAYVIVNRDDLSITLVVNEDDPYRCATIQGSLQYSKIFNQLGINSGKAWQPERLGQFLKLNRTYFVDREENMAVVNALKSFDAKVQQTIQRESKENGNRNFTMRQAVDSNIPESFTMRIPIFSGGPAVEIEVETYACIDGSDVTIALQSAGANDAVEEARLNTIDVVVGDIQMNACDMVIIEQ